MVGTIKIEPFMSANGVVIYVIICILVLAVITFIIHHESGLDKSDMPKVFGLSFVICFILRMTLFSPTVQQLFTALDVYNVKTLHDMTVSALPLEQAVKSVDTATLMGLRQITIDDLLGNEKEYVDLRLLKFGTSQQYVIVGHIKNNKFSALLSTSSNATPSDSSEVLNLVDELTGK